MRERAWDIGKEEDRSKGKEGGERTRGTGMREEKEIKKNKKRKRGGSGGEGRREEKK